ncbi:hypothetical protein RFI_29387 [Reticulomyxa filosa]|uniref:Uncharacterized protein n=1 Tax=Reticulomyxa filosa TaxID=46433 RepID=X6M3G0_RETFI|nr:hypothetical protein RFI_29387 [Reticulomyxa filosa]|eukprot:ETO08002.1 hypothetical protein RFI_29387 [Reticulomyxa filosa]
MGNRNTTSFQSLKDLPTPLSQSQCVLHKHELLICGGYEQRACYSYHTIKNEYKFICEYPSDAQLRGYCVVKLVDNNNKDKNQITLLSNKFDNYNQWISFTDNDNHSIIIGRDNDNYIDVRALIGGSNNHLLFITYLKNKISVFNLNTFQFIKHDHLPFYMNYLPFHCFVPNSENGQEQVQEMIKTNKQHYQMLLFCKSTGLLIAYDEDNNDFQFH